MTEPRNGDRVGEHEQVPLSPVSAADAVWTAARAVVDAPAYPYPRAKAIFALKEALQDYDDLIRAMAAALSGSSPEEADRG